jgi:hypothetical protein
MNIRKILLCAPLALLAPNLARADDANVTLMRQLYSKISQIVTVNQNEVRPGATYLVLLSPGILLDPSLNPDTSPQDRQTLDSVVEKTMDASWIYSPRNELTTDVYDSILQFHMAPSFQLSAGLKHELDGYNKKIFVVSADGTRTYTVTWEQYLDLKGKYAAAIDAYQTAINAHPGTLPPNSLATAMQQARDAYINLGNGPSNSAMLARKAQIDAYDPNTWWAELQDIFDTNTDALGSRHFARNFYYPKYATWLDPHLTWTTVSVSQSDLETTTTDGSSQTGGGLSASWGLWSVNADGNSSSQWHSLNSSVSQMSLTFDVMRVNINRPWMESDVFYSDAWQWGCGAPDHSSLSTGGNPAAGQQMSGRMPFLPTGMLLARNVNVSGNWGSTVNNSFSQQINAGGGFSFGPFSLGGNHTENHSNTYSHATATGSGFKFSDPQIIGFFVEALPVSPHPNPALHFDTCPGAPAVAQNPADQSQIARVKALGSNADH